MEFPFDVSIIRYVRKMIYVSDLINHQESPGKDITEKGSKSGQQRRGIVSDVVFIFKVFVQERVRIYRSLKFLSPIPSRTGVFLYHYYLSTSVLTWSYVD
jgi:hypothetical protein